MSSENGSECWTIGSLRVYSSHDVRSAGCLCTDGLISFLLIELHWLVVERLSMDVIQYADLFELCVIIWTKYASTHGFLVLLLIGLLVVDSQLGLREVLDVLVEIEAHLYLQLLEGRHQGPLFGKGQFVGMRAKQVDVERSQGEVGEGEDSLEVIGDGEDEIFWWTDLQNVHVIYDDYYYLASSGSSAMMRYVQI